MPGYPKVKSLIVGYDKAAGKILLEAKIASKSQIDYVSVGFGVRKGSTTTVMQSVQEGDLYLNSATGTWTWRGFLFVSPGLAKSGTLRLYSISAIDELLQNTIYRDNDKLSIPLYKVNIKGEIGNDYLFRPGAPNSSDGIIEVSGDSVSKGTKGRDLFFFRDPRDRGTIASFSKKDGDLIALSRIGFEEIDKIIFKSVKNSRMARRLETKKMNIIYDRKQGVIYYDANGKDEGLGASGGAIAFLKERPGLSGADFVLADIAV